MLKSQYVRFAFYLVLLAAFFEATGAPRYIGGK